MCFRRTRAKSSTKQNILRGGQTRGGTKAKRVDENSGFANLQFFSQKLKFLYKTTAITFFLCEKKTQNLSGLLQNPSQNQILARKRETCYKTNEKIPQTRLFDQDGAEYLTKTIV